MGVTNIEWCDFTFNAWEGCSRVSEGCRNCYAEVRAHRFGTVEWGPQGTRRIASESYWRQPLKWDRAAKAAGKRRRVFCASLADVFEDRPELVAPRLRLFGLIRDTENLDWLLLTKRPENIMKLWPRYIIHDSHCEPHQERWTSDLELGIAAHNIWLGVSVEDRAALWRIDALRKVPAALRFLSCEPLLEELGKINLDGVDWAIIGGESGSQARPCHLEWIRSIVRECQAAGVPVFVKQLGACASDPVNGVAGAKLYVSDVATPLISLRLCDPKGGNMEEWPEDLCIREFPW